jgi:hypothetical protein
MRLILYPAVLILVLGTVIYFDNRRPFLPDELYCVLGAGYEAILKMDASQLAGRPSGKAGVLPRPFVSAEHVCVHGSLWDGIEAFLSG